MTKSGYRHAETAVAAVGIAILASAVAANQQWLDRHFLPSFFLPRLWYTRLETIVRAFLGTVGLFVAFVARPYVARFLCRTPMRALQVALAAALALGASELVLRRAHPRPTEWLAPDEEPQRVADPRLGWVLAPSRTGYAVVGGRTVEYATDASGYRVRRSDDPVDPERPTVLFVGESVMFGEGLAWDETIPAQVETMLGVQSANLAVHGYSNDQAYLRLEAELPRFRRPQVVVALFMTALFGRNLDDDRPHLGPGLEWLPAAPASRLASLAGLLVPYRTDATVERGVQTTRAVLNAIVNLARTRGAEPLVVVPQFGPEDPVEQALRRRVVGDGIPQLLVVVDAGWRLSWDRHPNAQADRTIAEAIAARLRRP